MGNKLKIISLFFICILLGIPVWYKTTTVYRPHLPFNEINELSHKKIHSEEGWKMEIQLIICAHDEDVTIGGDFENKMFNFMVENKTFPQNIDFAYRVFIPKYKNKIDVPPTEYENFFHSSKNTQTGVYKFYIFESSNTTMTMGKHRDGYITLKDLNKLINQDKILRMISKFVSFVVFDSFPVSERSASLSSEYTISFNLLNAPGRFTSWDFDKIYHVYLEKFFREISATANITVSSQVKYFVPTIIKPRVDGSNTKYFSEEMLSHFLEIKEWTPDFTATTQKSLDFVVYIPNEEILIKTNGGSILNTNSFTIPRTGGVIVLNRNSNDTNKKFLTNDEIHFCVQILISQFKTLLGFAKYPTKINGFPFAHISGDTLSSWELDALSRNYIYRYLESSISSLQSISQLIQKLENIPVQDEKQQTIISSLEGYINSTVFLKNGSYSDALVSAKQSYVLSESMFFDSGMLAVLYFPDEHKYAIYLPLFFPIFFSLFSSFYSEFKKRKAKKLNQIKN
eukprot:TRINITY_DN15659_c0_g1_i1.p1 TRINITY_DN15659_c0_g1~~TRINITY_DN15659_c0_g1_i1.p1  ORF type:complete len:521 (+),score=128.94 TRINITY_DN15659_c0_g1_i1:30-1565(+)